MNPVRMTGKESRGSSGRAVLMRFIAVFVAAVLSRFAFLIFRGATVAPDTADYALIAQNIRHHFAFSLSSVPPLVPTIFRAPLYPAFLALFGDLGPHNSITIAAVQVLLDSVVAICVFMLARQCVPEGWALVAGIAYAVHPGAIAAATTLLSESLFGTLCAIGITFVAIGMRHDRLWLVVCGGIILGSAALCRSLGLFLPIMISTAIIFRRKCRRGFLYGTSIVFSALLVVIPWIFRSSLAAHALVLIQAPSLSLNLYYPTRTDWNQANQTEIWNAFFSDNPCGRAFSEASTPVQMVAVNRVCLQEAFENVRRAPGSYLLSRLKAFPHLFISSFDSFTGWNESFVLSFQKRHYPHLISKTVLLIAFSIIPFALAWIGLMRSMQCEAWLCALVWIFTLLIHLPMWIEYRYWVPALPFLFVSGAQGAWGIFSPPKRPNSQLQSGALT